jgi:pyruvate/2-oxoacid:ferredoxin oxidoreductase beta subunit
VIGPAIRYGFYFAAVSSSVIRRKFMQRVEKSGQKWMISTVVLASMMMATIVFVAGAYLGARAVSHGAVAVKQVHNGIMLVDGFKPCSSC